MEALHTLGGTVFAFGVGTVAVTVGALLAGAVMKGVSLLSGPEAS